MPAPSPVTIFLLHTPFQLFEAETLLRQHGKREFGRCRLFFDGPPLKSPPDARLWDEIRWFEGSSLAAHGRNRHREVEDLAQAVRGTEPTNIFISDIAWPANNRVFFDQKLRHIRFFMIADGLATYLVPQFSLRSRLRNVAKFFFGLLGLGVRYTPYRGDSLGLSQKRFRGVYAFNPELVGATHMPRMPITLAAADTARRDKVCMFLDQQGYTKFVPPERWREVRRRTFQFLAQAGFEHIIYKRHFMYPVDDIAEFQALNVEMLEKDAPIESLFGALDCGTVVSYTSTALFTIKAAWGAQVRTVSLFPDYLTTVDGYDAGWTGRYMGLMRATGVDIVPMGDAAI